MGAAVYSSGVAFWPPSERHWRIGNAWYDLAPFLDAHPGGRAALLLARDRFGDCTYVFEAHHHRASRARAVLARYRVGPAAGGPALCEPDGFYATLRARVAAHLASVGSACGGPTRRCHALFWATAAAWAAASALALLRGALALAALAGALGAVLGAFGHNWVHQPRYMWRARLALDAIGLSADGWFRDHNLQHHMYTNTPEDNHFRGTEPFLVTDPAAPRGWWQRNVTPYANPLVLAFGIVGNYALHTVELARGREVFSPTKLLWPAQAAVYCAAWGAARGGALFLLGSAVTSVWYFSLALMNHNSHRAHDAALAAPPRDWAERQVRTCADWCTDWSFAGSALFLWLNRHTLHHLFPRVDISHHAALQPILEATCREWGVPYTRLRVGEAYAQMIDAFRRRPAKKSRA